MGGISSHEIESTFCYLEEKNRRKFQGEHSFSNSEVELIKIYFKEKYPTSILIIEHSHFNIGTYQIKFSDSDFSQILQRNLYRKKEKLETLKYKYDKLRKEIIYINNTYNEINF
jgi:hypothetical protein